MDREARQCLPREHPLRRAKRGRWLLITFGRSLVKRGGLLRESVLYTLSSAANSAIPFILLPVLTRVLAPADFGIVAMFQVGVTILVPLIGLNTQNAIARQYYERHEVDFPAYVTSCLAIGAATFIPFVAANAIGGNVIAEVVGVPAAWIWTLPVVALGQFVTSVTLTHWQVNQNALKFGMFRILQTALNMGLSIFLVVAMHLAWRGRVLGEVMATGVLGIATISVLAKSGWLARGGVRRDYVVHAALFGGKSVPHTIGAILITMVDRFLIKNILGVSSVGIYFAGYQVGMVIALLQNSFNQAWVPWLFERLKRNDAKEKVQIVKLTYAYIVTIVAIAAVVALFAPIVVPAYLGPRYASATGVVAWIALAYAFNGMYKMVTNYIFYTGHTQYLSIITVAMGVFNVALAYVLIQRNGIVGAAQASCVSFALSFLLTWWVAQRVFPMPWRLRSHAVREPSAVCQHNDNVERE